MLVAMILLLNQTTLTIINMHPNSLFMTNTHGQ